MPPRGKDDARLKLLYELEALQDDLSTQWLDQSLPDDWSGLDWHAPVAPHRTRVTLRLDSDMLRWFRKLGPGYQARLNQVLRIYWMALVAGHIKGFPSDDTVPRLLIEARRIREENAARRGETL
ncbi:BrnA antitoxin family protein [Roseobacter ponti]|uniref:BrnA antitoxin of type II toxin-antitoxin system n=1 Tax=Roseobacter ponti TaxID=1891787 RepID=A0A858T0P1_9RHOB|nr:BrnA antitoxin family protein [Roseobacter ponti]QJF52776.1 hypothetical protein G3256_17150 [Roseobacter ponti]